MYLQVQRAFCVSPDRHYRLLNAATEDKPKIVVLTVLVQEADGIEAKDANGKSKNCFLLPEKYDIKHYDEKKNLTSPIYSLGLLPHKSLSIKTCPL